MVLNNRRNKKMKFILEWRKFLKEQNFIDDPKYDLQYDEEGDIILYHVSSTSGIEEFDPDIAAAGAKNYTTREYITWNRPRVFFFTKCGQEDTGIGQIPGQCFYKIKIPAEKLYPVMEDPAQLSSLQNKQEWMIENVPGFKEAFDKAEKCDTINNNYYRMHPCRQNENSQGLAWISRRFGTDLFLVNSPKFHSQKPNVYEMVAKLAEERYGVIGFIYPQEAGNLDTLIATIWRPVKAYEFSDFY